MADIFLIFSRDRETISHTSQKLKARLSLTSPEIKIDCFEGNGWSLISGRNPFVPYAVSDDPGGAAVVIGTTLDQRGPTISDLRQENPGLRIQTAREFCRRLNYGVAVSIRHDEAIITADYLGLYPLFYYHDDGAFIVTSAPGFLTCYPDFQPKIDIEGLVGILLLGHSVLSHTMFQGVFRLGQGIVLNYAPGRQIKQDKVSLRAEEDSPKDMDEVVEAFDRALSSAVGAAVAQGARSVLLSGGLDSRIMASYLHRISDGDISAVTLGDQSDHEMQAASRVVSAIGASHEAIPVDQSNYEEFARRALNTDALSSGLYALNFWEFSRKPRRPVITGFLGDTLMGTSHVSWGREPHCDLHTFDRMFKTLNSWGLSPGIVRELVRADDIDDIIFDVWRGLHDEYYSYPGEPWQRSWWFDRLHRQRFLVCRLPKIIAQRSWPILPFAHPTILEIATMTPLPLLAERRAQIELVRGKFPFIARLPVAGNVAHKLYTIMPRKPRRWTRYMNRVNDSLLWHLRKLLKYPDRRYVVRAFDFNGPGWKVLRDQARLLSDGTDAYLNKDVVLQLIPDSSSHVELKLPISEATGRRTLIGAILCCSQYFTAR